MRFSAFSGRSSVPAFRPVSRSWQLSCAGSSVNTVCSLEISVSGPEIERPRLEMDISGPETETSPQLAQTYRPEGEGGLPCHGASPAAQSCPLRSLRSSARLCHNGRHRAAPRDHGPACRHLSAARRRPHGQGGLVSSAPTPHIYNVSAPSARLPDEMWRGRTAC